MPIEHTSDCAMHRGPAYEPGPCDCGGIVRVRVKVLVNAAGKYVAYGYTSAGDGDHDDVLCDMMSGEDTATAREFTVTAEIPLPHVVEVAACAVEAIGLGAAAGVTEGGK